MGYDITIIKPNEIDDRFVPQYKHYDEKEVEAQINDIKYDIIKVCMEPPKENILVNNNDLRFRLKTYITLLGEYTRNRIASDIEKNGEVHFCGWHLVTHDECSLDSIIDYTLDNLIEYRMLVRTPDFFEERNNFYEKLNLIKEQLDLEETVCDYISRDFVQTYKDKYEKKFDEDEPVDED